MNKKRVIYLVGLLLMAIGTNFGVIASLGLSPVTSLGYSFSLILPISIGMGILLCNFICAVLQILLTQKIELQQYMSQFLTAFILSILIDITKLVFDLLPFINTVTSLYVYLLISILLLAVSTFLYVSSGLPLLPYDTLMSLLYGLITKSIGAIRMCSDIITVICSAILCQLAIGSIESVGIGTVFLYPIRWSAVKFNS